MAFENWCIPQDERHVPCQKCQRLISNYTISRCSIPTFLSCATQYIVTRLHTQNVMMMNLYLVLNQVSHNYVALRLEQHEKEKKDTF